jgi:hypothetical protein
MRSIRHILIKRMDKFEIPARQVEHILLRVWDAQQIVHKDIHSKISPPLSCLMVAWLDRRTPAARLYSFF